MRRWGALLGVVFVVLVLASMGSVLGLFAGWPMWFNALLLCGAAASAVLLIFVGSKYSSSGR